jgi:hypothetical protein
MKTISRTIPAAATTINVPTNNIDFVLPASVTLHSADATRAIELSTNGGLDYFTPQIPTTAYFRIGDIHPNSLGSSILGISAGNAAVKLLS